MGLRVVGVLAFVVSDAVGAPRVKVVAAMPTMHAASDPRLFFLLLVVVVGTVLFNFHVPSKSSRELLDSFRVVDGLCVWLPVAYMKLLESLCLAQEKRSNLRLSLWYIHEH